MSYCCLKTAGFRILQHGAVFVKKKKILKVIYLCLNMKMSTRTCAKTFRRYARSGRIWGYLSSRCLPTFYNLYNEQVSPRTNSLGQEIWGKTGGHGACALGVRRARPTLTLARMVKASGSSTRSPCSQCPAPDRIQHPRPARFFFKVVMVVMTVCRRTPGSPRRSPHTISHPQLLPGQSQERKRAKEEEEVRVVTEDLSTKVLIAANLIT